MKLQIALQSVYDSDDHVIVEHSTTLFIDEQEMRFESITVPLLQLVMHAICNDLSSFPYPCIYCQLEDEKELRLVVQDVRDLDTIFEVLCKNVEQIYKQDQVLQTEEQEQEEEQVDHQEDADEEDSATTKKKQKVN